MRAPGATPTTPMLLSSAAAVPATCVPWPWMSRPRPGRSRGRRSCSRCSRRPRSGRRPWRRRCRRWRCPRRPARPRRRWRRSRLTRPPIRETPVGHRLGRQLDLLVGHDGEDVRVVEQGLALLLVELGGEATDRALERALDLRCPRAGGVADDGRGVGVRGEHDEVATGRVGAGRIGAGRGSRTGRSGRARLGARLRARGVGSVPGRRSDRGRRSVAVRRSGSAGVAVGSGSTVGSGSAVGCGFRGRIGAGARRGLGRRGGSRRVERGREGSVAAAGPTSVATTSDTRSRVASDRRMSSPVDGAFGGAAIRSKCAGLAGDRAAAALRSTTHPVVLT